MTPSDKQQKIYDTWINTMYNIVINAVAGAGKSFTLLELMKLCKKRTLYLAFNKSIQKEFEEKIVKNNLTQYCKALTLHALGLMAIKNVTKSFTIEDNKVYKKLFEFEKKNKSYFKFIPYTIKKSVYFSLYSLYNSYRLNLNTDLDFLENSLRERDIALIYPDDKEEFEAIFLKFIIFMEDYNKKRESGYLIDFLDMIYLPVRYKFKIPINPEYLMIDEVQDLTALQHSFVDKLLTENGVEKWIAVGDRNQAIYGFSGANSSSFDILVNKENVIELPLDICYRCDLTIIAKANSVYNVMQGFKTTEGIVSTYNFDLKKDNNKINDFYNNIKPGSLIICRNKKPLITLLIDLMELDIECSLMGDDILLYLTSFLKDYKDLTIWNAETVIKSNIEDFSKKCKDYEKYKVDLLEENYSNFLLLKKLVSPQSKISDLIDKIKKLFEEHPNDIKLCTIHKSKGLEADIVYILNEDLIGKQAVSKEQKIQEKNLMYVARTRAKKEMYFLNIKNNK